MPSHSQSQSQSQPPALHAASIQHADLRVSQRRGTHSGLHTSRSHNSLLSFRSALTAYEQDEGCGNGRPDAGDQATANPSFVAAAASASDAPDAPHSPPNPQPLSVETILERREHESFCHRIVLIFSAVCFGVSVLCVALGIGALMMSRVRVVDSARASAGSLLYPPSDASGGLPEAVVSCASLSSFGCDMAGLDDIVAFILRSSRSAFPTLLDSLLASFEPFDINVCTKGSAGTPYVQLSLASHAYPNYEIPSLLIRCAFLDRPDRFAFSTVYGTVVYVEHIHTGSVSQATLGSGEGMTFSLPMSSSNRCHLSALCFLVSALLLNGVALLLLWLMQCRLLDATAPVERRWYPEALPPPSSFMAIVVDGEASAESEAYPWSRSRFQRSSAARCGGAGQSHHPHHSPHAHHRHGTATSHQPRPTTESAAPKQSSGDTESHPQPPTFPPPSRSGSVSSLSHSGTVLPGAVDEDAEMTTVIFPFGVAQYAANPSNSRFELPSAPAPSGVFSREDLCQEDAAPAHTTLQTADSWLKIVDGSFGDDAAAPGAEAHGSFCDVARTHSASTAATSSGAFSPLKPTRSEEPLTRASTPHRAGVGSQGDVQLEPALPAVISLQGSAGTAEAGGYAATKATKPQDSPAPHDAAAAAAAGGGGGAQGCPEGAAAAASTHSTEAITPTNPLHRGLAVENRDVLLRQRTRRIKRIRMSHLAARQTLMTLSTLSMLTALVLVLVAMILRGNGATTYNSAEAGDSVAAQLGIQVTVTEYKSVNGSYYILSIITVLLSMATTALLILTMVKSSRAH